MNGRSPKRRALVYGAVTAAILAAAVLFVMHDWQGSEPAPERNAAATVVTPSGRDVEERVEDDHTIDFSDPAAGGLIPLMRVEGRTHERLSPNLRVGDLAARDGAPFARISVELIEALEEVITATDASIHVISGYRHPARNALPEISGAAESQHIAGRAADLTSPDMTALELAGLVLDALGCDIGLGLGATAIHMDVRARRAVWAKEGAALSGEAFAAWVAERCGDEPSAEAGEAADEPEMDVDAIIAAHEDAMRLAARRMFDAGIAGGVALDLRGDAPAVYAVPAVAPDAVGLGLVDLIAQAHPGRYYAFACIVRDGDVIRGFMRL